jgi:hypothetical protein
VVVVVEEAAAEAVAAQDLRAAQEVPAALAAMDHPGF